jgi:integrase/recombinase XerD
MPPNQPPTDQLDIALLEILDHRRAAHKVLGEVVETVPELDGISTHSFRRSFATNLARAGRPQAEIQRLLGHRSAVTTDRYVG